MKANLIKTTIAALGLALALIITPSQIAQAAEFTVTDVSAVLWTNEATQLCSDADTSTVVVPVVEAGLPVQVTGVTDNGFFQVLIGTEVYYIPGIGLSADTSTTTTDTTATATTSSTGWTQESVYAALMNLKATKYPQGTSWDDNKHETINYTWYGESKVYTNGGYGGAAFAYRVMKDIFGDDVVITDLEYTEDINDLKIGDVIYWGGQYWVITGIDDTYVYTVCGNMHISSGPGFVDWTFKIAINDLLTTTEPIEDEYGNIIARYTVPTGISYCTAY